MTRPSLAGRSAAESGLAAAGRSLVELGRLSARAAWQAFLRVYNGDDLTFASSIAYYSLLSLFPFLLLAISLLGRVTADEARRTEVVLFVLRYFPVRFQFVTGQLDAFRESRVSVGLFGSLALIWAALGVFSAVSTAVNHAWGVEKQRSYFKHKFVSFLMLLAAGGVLVVALVLMSGTQLAQAGRFEAVLAHFPGLSVLQSATIRLATTVLLVVVVGLIYYFVPNAPVRFRDVWVGAVLTGVLIRGVTAVFSWYIRDMSRFTLIHGSIGAVVAFLLWVYLSAVIFMYGVEFTAAYGRLRRASDTNRGA